MLAFFRRRRKFMNLSTGILFALIGVGIAGLASVIGIWMERDPNRPRHWALSLSVLILLTTTVSMFQSYQDALDSEQMEEDVARMLAQLDKLASESDVEIPGLNDLISKELSAQSRSNPGVLDKVSARVAADGGDPNAMLSKFLPSSDVTAQKPDSKGGAVNPAAQAQVEKLRRELKATRSEMEKVRSTQKDLKEKLQQEEEKEEKRKAEQKASEEKILKLEEQNEKLKTYLTKVKQKKGLDTSTGLWSTKG